jgi:hypothetical protein
VVVERPDGSQRRDLDLGCAYPFYAVAVWSPDGRKLLVMRDEGGFSMFAVPVVKNVRVNNARSWPGRGDVSRQPRPS